MTNVIELLDVEFDKRLQDLTKEKLVEICSALVSNLDKKALTALITDDRFFSLTDIVNWLDKRQPDILFKILNEPSAESGLRQPVYNWLRDQGLSVKYEIALPMGGRDRSVDVCGFKGGLLSTTLIAVELKSDPSRSAVDKAFAQARDNAKGVDKSYIAFSPYVYLKYSEVIEKRGPSYKDVGILIADSMRVIVTVSDPKESKFDEKVYKSIKIAMESQ